EAGVALRALEEVAVGLDRGVFLAGTVERDRETERRRRVERRQVARLLERLPREAELVEPEQHGAEPHARRSVGGREDDRALESVPRGLELVVGERERPLDESRLGEPAPLRVGALDD